MSNFIERTEEKLKQNFTKAGRAVKKRIISARPILQFVKSATGRKLALKAPEVSGFFSCCSIKISGLSWYLEKYGKLPRELSCEEMLKPYKPYDSQEEAETYDAFSVYFEASSPANDIQLSYRRIANNHYDYFLYYQYAQYNQLDFTRFLGLRDQFFSPNEPVKEFIELFQRQLSISTDDKKFVGVYYRGTDKEKETTIAEPELFMAKMHQLEQQHGKLTFVVQSDVGKFYELCTNEFENVLSFPETGINQSETSGYHFENSNTKALEKSTQALLASFIVLSKLEHLICSSSNGSLWINLYRNNTNNVHQFLNGEFIG